MNKKFLLFLFFMFLSLSSHAYIGPGIGAGTLAAVAGVLVSVFAAIFAVTYYPIKRILKKRKGAKKDFSKKAQANKVIDNPEKRDED